MDYESCKGAVTTTSRDMNGCNVPAGFRRLQIREILVQVASDCNVLHHKDPQRTTQEKESTTEGIKVLPPTGE